MTKRVTDLQYLEEQIGEVESRLHQAVTLLGQLKSVQDKFVDLAKYYNTTKTNFAGLHDEVEGLREQLNAAYQESREQLSGFEGRFSDLTQESVMRLTTLYSDSQDLVRRTQDQVETLTGDIAQRSEVLTREQEALQESLRGELRKAEDNLQAAFRNLRGDVQREGSDLRGDIERRLESYRRDLAAVKTEAQAGQERVATALERVEHEVQTGHHQLNTTVERVRGNLANVDRRVKTNEGDLQKATTTLTELTNKTAGLNIISFLALGLAVIALLMIAFGLSS